MNYVKVKKILFSWLRACFILLAIMAIGISFTESMKFITSFVVNLIIFNWELESLLFLILSVIGAIIVYREDY